MAQACCTSTFTSDPRFPLLSSLDSTRAVFGVFLYSSRMTSQHKASRFFQLRFQPALLSVSSLFCRHNHSSRFNTPRSRWGAIASKYDQSYRYDWLTLCIPTRERLARLKGAAMVVSYSVLPFLASGSAIPPANELALRFLLSSAMPVVCSK